MPGQDDGRSIPLAIGRIVELAEAIGVKAINNLPGCWEVQVDDRWRIAVNAHTDGRKTESGVDVPGGHFYVEFNGWPAGLLTFRGGTIAAGEAANEDTFIAALDARIEKERA